VGGRWRERVGEKEKRRDAADMAGARPTLHAQLEKRTKVRNSCKNVCSELYRIISSISQI
jgi:hypothetical protein